MFMDKYFLWFLLLVTHVSGLKGQIFNDSSLEDSMIAEKYYSRAISYQESGNEDSAIYYLKISADIFDSLLDWDPYLRCINKIMEICIESKKMIALRQYSKNALKIINASIEVQRSNLADTYYYLGYIYLVDEIYDSSLLYYNKGINTLKDLIANNNLHAHKKYLALFYYNTGITFDLKGNKKLALENYKKALTSQINLLGENNPQVATTYINIGLNYQCNEDYYKAIQIYNEVLRILDYNYQTKTLLHAYVYNNIGAIYHDQEKYDDALFYYNLSHDLRLEFYDSDDIELAISYMNTGSIYIKVRDFLNAVENTKKAINIYEKNKIKKSLELSMCYNNLGTIYKNKCEYETAIKYYNHSLDIRITAFGLNHPSVVQSYNNIGKVHILQNDFEKALRCFQKAIIANVIEFSDTNVFSNPNLESEILSKLDLFISLTKKAFCLYKYTVTSKQYYSIINIYDRAFNLLNMIRSDQKSINSKFFLAEKSKDTFNEAIDILYNFSNNSQDGNLIKQKIYEIFEKCKGIILYSLLNELKVKDNANIPDTLINKETEIRRNLSNIINSLLLAEIEAVKNDSIIIKLKRKNFSLSQELDSIEIFYEENYPIYYKLKYTHELPSIKSIKKRLKNSSILIEYYITDTSLYIMVITENDFDIIRLENNNINELIYRHINNIKLLDYSQFKEVSFMLYNIFILPIENYLNNKTGLIIIPDENLFYLPFETLISDKNYDDLSFTALDYLIKKYSITYHYSSSLWCENTRNDTNIYDKKLSMVENSFIGFAPVFSSDNIQTIEFNNNYISSQLDSLTIRSFCTLDNRVITLPYTKEEVLEIVNLFREKGYKSKSYIFSEANEINFKRNITDFKYVHIATHGFANDNYPDLSGLVLSGDIYLNDKIDYDIQSAKTDGIIYANEIYNLNTNADLVVLSACETGIGKLIKGEGMIAITRGFLYCGVPNIIYSLWKISDKHTKELMIEFYKSLLKGNSYANSLRLAKLKLIGNDKSAFPMFWGGIVIMGY